LTSVLGNGVAQEVEVTVELPLFWPVDASFGIGSNELTATVIDFTGVGGWRGGRWDMMMGVIVGVILGVIVGVIVPVIVSMVMSVLVSVLVSMIVVVVVVVIVITSSEQLLQIGSGVHHIDRREAYDYQMAKHCRRDTMCLVSDSLVVANCSVETSAGCLL